MQYIKQVYSQELINLTFHELNTQRIVLLIALIRCITPSFNYLEYLRDVLLQIHPEKWFGGRQNA